MKLVPLYNKVIVELIPEANETRTSSGIVIPGKINPYYKGKVISVGKGFFQNAQRVPNDIEVGQIAYFLKHSGMGIKFDDAGNPLQIVLADTDIYAVEENEDNNLLKRG